MASNENRTVVVTSVVLSVISVMMAKMLKESDGVLSDNSSKPTSDSVAKLNYVRKKRRTGKPIVSNPRAHYPEKKSSQRAGVPVITKPDITKPPDVPSTIISPVKVQPNPKPSPQKLSFIERLIQLKKIGVNSVKDFLEVGELNLRLETEKEAEKEEGTEMEGVKVIWDSDGSFEYIMIISPSYISKSTPLQHSNISAISEEDIKDRTLERSVGKRWKRKAIISNNITTSNITSSSTLSNSVSFYRVPFTKFHCRLISSNGRISRDLQYSGRSADDINDTENTYVTAYKKPEIDAWITYSDRDDDNVFYNVDDKIYYMNVQEDAGINSSSVSKIHEYNVILYIDGGKGLIRKIPYFTGYTKYKLGRLPPCLCYISGVRTTGTAVEQFVTWISQK